MELGKEIPKHISMNLPDTNPGSHSVLKHWEGKELSRTFFCFTKVKQNKTNCNVGKYLDST